MPLLNYDLNKSQIKSLFNPMLNSISCPSILSCSFLLLKNEKKRHKFKSILTPNAITFNILSAVNLLSWQAGRTVSTRKSPGHLNVGHIPDESFKSYLKRTSLNPISEHRGQRFSWKRQRQQHRRRCSRCGAQKWVLLNGKKNHKKHLSIAPHEMVANVPGNYKRQ